MACVRNSGGATERGFTLLELLVAMVIFAVGMLALSALQGNALRFNSDAYQRSQAVFLAMDMADRMRANLVGVNDNGYAGISNAATAIPAPVNCVGNACNDIQMAQFDAAEWLTSVAQLLPSGTASVTCLDSNAADVDPCTNGSVHTITINWLSRMGGRIAVAGTTESYSMSFQP